MALESPYWSFIPHTFVPALKLVAMRHSRLNEATKLRINVGCTRLSGTDICADWGSPRRRDEMPLHTSESTGNSQCDGT